MTLAAMLHDVLRSLFQRPVTERYPFERRAAPERLRGQLHFKPEQCTGCCLCAKDCPANAIELITVDKAQKRFVLRYHMDRCAFCAQCLQSCRHGCLEMSDEQWELAALKKEAFTVHYGNEADIADVLAKLSRANAEPTKQD
jgi:formate hydrogenlyase subunit 6/NADH:ubiquinone oxidoreductase subunit I